MFSRKGYWLPVCDTQTNCKGKSDHYFVLGINENFQNVRCVLCKGSYYPPTIPRPAVAEIPLQLPMCETATEKGLLEEKFWRSQLAYSTVDNMCKIGRGSYMDKDALDRNIKETVIKLFALACRSGLEYRAVELCDLMPSHHVVQLAVKYASKLGKMNLADKVSEVAAHKLEESEEGLQNCHVDIYTSGYMSDRVESPLLSSKSISHEESWNHDSTEVNGHSEDPTKTCTESESLLLAAVKQKRSANRTEIKPVMSLSQKRLNPFKKSVTKAESGRGLENLGASFAQQLSNKNRHSSTPEQSSHQQTKVKQTTLSALKPVDVPAAQTFTKKLPTFFEWYEKEKEALAEEFPDMSASELSRLGMKRFKVFIQKDKLVPVTGDSHTESQTVTSEAKKRKPEEESESQEEKPPKKIVTSSSSKLMAFAFKKS